MLWTHAKEKVWFLCPGVEEPAGGVNNMYRLCWIAEMLGIHARVLSTKPYPYVDPPDLIKYWVGVSKELTLYSLDAFDHPDMKEGDIVVQPDIYSRLPFRFSRPVRLVVYIQNWALVHPNNPWQLHYWVYHNMTHMGYCLETVAPTFSHRKQYSFQKMGLDETREILTLPKKIRWSTVSPFFYEHDDPPTTISGSEKTTPVLLFGRKTPDDVSRVLQQILGDSLRILHDFLTPQEARMEIAKSHILCMVSPAEGLCFPAVEAMRAGTVVATWHCGAIEDYVFDGTTGILVPYGDVVGMAHKIRQLLEDNEHLESIRSNASTLIRRLFTMDQAKTEFYQAYHTTLYTPPM